MTRAVLALGVSVTGWLVSVVAALIAQTTVPGGDLAAWATGGGSAAAVGGLVYMARLLATGRLVARDPAKVESKLIEVVNDLGELVRQGHQREDDYRKVFVERARQAERPRRTP